MNAIVSKILQALRQSGGVISAPELQAVLGVSQPTVSRALAPLLRSGELQKVGAARSQRYVLPRTVAGVGRQVPIMRVDARGQVSPFASLVPLVGGAMWVDEADGLSQRYDSLPWFLDDMRPQGFMGRTFAHAHPELQLSPDPRHWNDDDCLRALALYGDDLPGNLIVGEAAFARFHSLPERASRVASAADYPALAEQAMQGTLAGSSAGGEQPKFCTVNAGRAVLVKFSSAGDSPAEQRGRDLLLCEHLALQTLEQAGISAARTQVFSAAGRVFLESERFDRVPAKTAKTAKITEPAEPAEPAHAEGREGRVGMVSLLVYDAEYVGAVDNWADTADRMAARGLLTRADAGRLRLLEAFGILIANTDRHYGNISLLLADDDWTLAPCYDMLPMLYAPINGELVARDFSTRRLQPTAATLPEWPQALVLARLFWQAAANDERISSGFRAIAAANLTHFVEPLVPGRL